MRFASDVPYGYSNMIDHVKEVANKQEFNNFLQVSTIAYTLSSKKNNISNFAILDVEVPMLTISEDV